jgi:hypothetical protein
MSMMSERIARIKHFIYLFFLFFYQNGTFFFYAKEKIEATPERRELNTKLNISLM